MAQEGTTTTEERRGSFGRTFAKLKDAVRRRSLAANRKSISEEPATATTAEDSKFVQPADTTTEEPLSPIQADSTPRAVDNTAMATTAQADGADAPLVVDDDYTGDYDQSSGPIYSIRNRFASARAKAVFDKYGIKYEEGDKVLDDGSKRVEKAIRIRIHWECHECHASFSGRRTCAKCGHKRCPDCPRAPAKRVKEVLGDTQVMKEIEKKAEQAPAGKDSVVVPIATEREPAAAAAAAAAAPAPEEPTSEPVASDEETRETEVLTGPEAETALPEEVQGTLEQETGRGPDGETNVTQSEFVMQRRPNSGVNFLFRPKSHYIRRVCHECQTNFKQSSRNKCLNCGHDRCNDCPREKLKSDTNGDVNQPEGEQPMIGRVDRVYRKARMRIRWECHECKTVFIGRAACANCGHARCQECTRTPVMKVVAPPNPDVMASLEQKMNATRINTASVEPATG